MIARLLARFARPLRFAAVGGTGFLVDAGLTETLVRLGIGPYAARVFAVAVAIAVTYALNRRFTFRRTAAAMGDGRSHAGERRRYLAVSLASIALNYLVYALALAVCPGLMPALAVACGSAVAMVSNYVGYSRFVFRRDQAA